jgi:hypothetical protein
LSIKRGSRPRLSYLHYHLLILGFQPAWYLHPPCSPSSPSLCPSPPSRTHARQ